MGQVHQRLGAPVGAGAQGDQVQGVADGGQQVVEFMGQAAGQPADIVQLALLHVRALRILQQALGLVAFGDILGDLDETEQAAVFADRLDHLAGAEPLAIAAHPPPFTDEAAMVPGVRQRLLRDAQLLVFGGIEQADVLADDGLGGIALDPFAATVPAADTALRIEQIDRVIAHVVDQQLQLPAFVGERCNAGYGLDHDGYRLPR